MKRSGFCTGIFLTALFCFIQGWIFVAGVFGDEAEQTFTRNTEGLSLFALGIRVAFVLIFIIVLIFLAVLILKRVMSGRRAGVYMPGAVEILGMTYIAPRKSVAIIKVLNRAYIVGITDSGINKLGEIPLSEALEFLPETGGKKFSSSFKDVLKKWGIGKNA